MAYADIQYELRIANDTIKRLQERWQQDIKTLTERAERAEALLAQIRELLGE